MDTGAIRIGHSVLVDWNRVHTSIAARHKEIGNGPFRVVNVSRELRVAWVEIASAQNVEFPIGALRLTP